MRIALSICLVAACAADEPISPQAPAPIDEAWATSLHPGDVVVLIPGTGAKTYLGDPIDALPGDHPTADVHAIDTVRSDSVVFEQAIAAAERAGFTHDQIEGGALTFLLWGAGFQRVQSFDYVSYENLRVPVAVLGGLNSCGTGLIEDNYLNYSADNAKTDATDAYQRLAAWLTAHPSPSPRNAVVVSHSWGGAVGEYLAFELPTIAGGPLADGTQMPLTVAAGVPPYVIGYDFMGPNVRDLHRPWGETSLVYEVDRPDDPVHNLTFSGNGAGHFYNIVFGDAFQGAYGITTDELSCGTVPGPCTTSSP